MWQSNTFSQLTVESPAIDKFIKHYNETRVGGAVIACFEVNNNDVFSNLPVTDGCRDYIKNLLFSDDIVKALSELYISYPFSEELDFSRTSPFIFEGIITAVLYEGDFINKYLHRIKLMKKIATKLADFIIEDRYYDFAIYCTDRAWSNWFYDFGFDRSWIILDTNKNRLWLVLLTEKHGKNFY